MKKFSVYLKILTLAILGSSLIACGNKDSDTRSGGGVPGVVNGVGVCTPCAGWGGQAELFLGSGYGSASFPMAMTIELLGDSNRMKAQPFDPSKTYNGPTFLRQAAINVSANIPTGQCLLPAGTYNLAPTTNQGSFSGGSFVIPRFEMTNGSSRFVMSLQQGAVVAPFVGGPPTGFGAMLVVIAGPGRYNPAGMVNCMDPGFQLAPN